jgi:hypothetical protein
LILRLIASFAVKSWSEMAGDASGAGEWKVFKSITFNRGATLVMTPPRISSHSVLRAIKKPIDNPKVVGNRLNFRGISP